jgi:hypothetical protein
MFGADGNRYSHARFVAGGINLTGDVPKRNSCIRDLGGRAGAFLFEVRSAGGGSRHRSCGVDWVRMSVRISVITDSYDAGA